MQSGPPRRTSNSTSALEQAVDKVQEQMREQVTGPLESAGVELTPIELSTTAERVIARLRVAGSEQLGGPHAAAAGPGRQPGQRAGARIGAHQRRGQPRPRRQAAHGAGTANADARKVLALELAAGDRGRSRHGVRVRRRRCRAIPRGRRAARVDSVDARGRITKATRSATSASTRSMCR